MNSLIVGAVEVAPASSEDFSLQAVDLAMTVGPVFTWAWRYCDDDLKLRTATSSRALAVP